VQLLFGTGVAFGLVTWAVVTSLYIWPQLRTQSRVDALRPLLVLHAFRFIGLSLSGSRRGVARSAARVPALRGLWRHRRRDFFGRFGHATEWRGDCAGLGVQPLGLFRSSHPFRAVIPGKSNWKKCIRHDKQAYKAATSWTRTEGMNRQIEQLSGLISEL
jgi:hypothetical protein